MDWDALLSADAWWRAGLTPEAQAMTERALLREQKEHRDWEAAQPKGGPIGLVAGEPTPSLWVPILTGQEPDDEGKICCVNPDHEDRTPSMHVYDDHVTCFGRCGVQTKMVGVAAMTLGLGEQVGNRWVTHSSERPAIHEHLRNLGLRAE
jgi:hypothetical protein